MLACSLLLCRNVNAQENDFDLSSQRSEIRSVLPVPGYKVDHKGLVINPSPHQLQLLDEPVVDITSGFRIKDVQGKFSGDLDFLHTSSDGVRLTIDFGRKYVKKYGLKPVSGAYFLLVGGNRIVVAGYDERGAFYGLQTLRQLVEAPVSGEGGIPSVCINDYPDLPDRGVVEGFYGTPWSHEVRMSLIDFYGKFKLNTYIYGPKDDPYHSCPNWRLPYPDKEAENIRRLVEACRRNRVDFVWAIHPGQDIKWNEEDYNNLVNKFNLMYDLGVRHFAIFFDDISGDGTNPLKQTELLNHLTSDFVEAKGDVSPLIVCPTDYSQLWANPTENGALAIYGRTLNPSIKVFWTGAVVCSDLTPETLEFVDSRIRRPAYYWWNYPVTDYVRNILLQGPVYGLDTSLTDKQLCGLLSNPMEHGEASKLALYSVADYTWNMKGYNAIDSWERGLAELVPGATDAYRTFAINSCDTENGYRRDESWETKTFTLDQWTDDAAENLEDEFIRVESAYAGIEAGCTNEALLDELRPWLVEFTKLGVRGRYAIALGKAYRSGVDDEVFWNDYVHNIMTPEDRRAYEAHKSGTMKLQPFYENMMDDMAHGFVRKLSGVVPVDFRGLGTFDNSCTVQSKLMLDNDSTTFYTSGQAQKDGDWIGLDLRAVRPVSEVKILQGRNSTDDVDYFDHAVLECSMDGRSWMPMTGELDRQYVINWKGEPVEARYVRLRRLDSKRTNYASVRSFEVNPIHAGNLGFRISAADLDEALSAFDKNPSTSYHIDGKMSFGVLPGVRSYVLLMSPLTAPVRVSELDSSGNVVRTQETSSAYFEFDISDQQVADILIEGNAGIYEIIEQY